MYRGFLTSFIGHALLLGWALISIHRTPEFMPETVAIEATPQLVCQRCLQGFAFAAAGSSEIEFSSGLGWGAANSQREVYETDEGWVSLRELAEEELLLALPIVAMHAPQACGRAPSYEAAGDIQDLSGDRSRPFAVLQDLLKKT